MFGKHSVRAVLLARPEAITRLILGGKESYHRDLIELARKAGVRPELLAWPEFRRVGDVTDDDKHQGIVALTTPRPLLTEADLGQLADARVVLALDQISDPQNLGTILRSAAFFGVDATLVLKNRAAEVSPLVARVAVGGAELVDTFRVTNLARSLQILKGHGVLDLRPRRATARRRSPRPSSTTGPCSSSAPRARGCAGAPGRPATRSCGSPAAGRGWRASTPAWPRPVALAEVFRDR